MQPELNSTQTQPSCAACSPSLQPSLPVALLGPQLDSKIFLHILLFTGHHMLLIEHNAVPLPARILHSSLLSSPSLDYTTLTSARGVRKIMNRFPPDPWPQLPVLLPANFLRGTTVPEFSEERGGGGSSVVLISSNVVQSCKFYSVVSNLLTQTHYCMN